MATGEMRLPTEMVTRVFAGIRSGGTSEEDVGLTPREKERLVSSPQGMSYVGFAKASEVKPVTITNAKGAIQGRLGLDSMQEVVV